MYNNCVTAYNYADMKSIYTNKNVLRKDQGNHSFKAEID